MPKDIDYDELEAILNQYFSDQQREWIARLMHDHISGLVTNLAMQIEIVKKMIEREMDMDAIAEEVAALKENISTTSAHIVQIEKSIKPRRPADPDDPDA
ncbi:MAG: hypothetical protein ACLFTK_07815 [Anaerolineales bacterium]